MVGDEIDGQHVGQGFGHRYSCESKREEGGWSRGIRARSGPDAGEERSSRRPAGREQTVALRSEPRTVRTVGRCRAAGCPGNGRWEGRTSDHLVGKWSAPCADRWMTT